jgi:broad specificity phosphatase PhoE
MSTIYFIRHAQAGSRDNYDLLSDLGKSQAKKLGEHFAEQGITLRAVYAGGMRRQRETAELACEAIVRAGLFAPDVVVDERWNEFSLISVYRRLAKLMMKEDAAFARDIREMQEAIARDPHTTGGAVGRCDQAVIRAWMENRYPDHEDESWSSFRTRITTCSKALEANNSDAAIAIFTSATPIAIVASAALGLTDDKLLSILGVIYNTSISAFRERNGELRLFTFNATPHLGVSQRTFR